MFDREDIGYARTIVGTVKNRKELDPSARDELAGMQPEQQALPGICIAVIEHVASARCRAQSPVLRARTRVSHPVHMDTFANIVDSGIGGEIKQIDTVEIVIGIDLV